MSTYGSGDGRTRQHQSWSKIHQSKDWPWGSPGLLQAMFFTMCTSIFLSKTVMVSLIFDNRKEFGLVWNDKEMCQCQYPTGKPRENHRRHNGSSN